MQPDKPDPIANDAERQRASVLGTPIDCLTADEAVTRISAWARRRESRYICICNVHSVVTASREPTFRAVVEQADMATPDGAPVAWMLRRLGHVGQRRVCGPDLMLDYCAYAARQGESIYLYGSTPTTLAAVQAALRERFHGLRIAGAESPPFRPLTTEEDDAVVDRINSSGAGSVWVSLGCPKQEQWMSDHRGRVQAVMVGVGAAFDFHAGTVQRAPGWMRSSGLEWLHRLLSEPRRLWKRYLVTNTLFIVGVARQLMTSR